MGAAPDDPATEICDISWNVVLSCNRDMLRDVQVRIRLWRQWPAGLRSWRRSSIWPTGWPRGRRSVCRSATTTTSSARTIASRAQLGESLEMQDGPRTSRWEYPLNVPRHRARIPFLSALLLLCANLEPRTRRGARAYSRLRSFTGAVLLTGRCHARAAC